MKRKCSFPRKEPRLAPWLFSLSWEQRKVSEIGSFSKGTGYSKSDIRDKGTPLILYGRLYTKYETVIRDVDTFTTPKDGSVYSRGGEVIIPASGETAEDISIASVVEKYGVILGGDLNIVTPQSGIDSAFLALSISHGEAHRSLSKLAQGKSVVHIHNSDIQTVEVGIPVQAEQESISQFFEGVDRLITLHQRVLYIQIGLILDLLLIFAITWEQREVGEWGDFYYGKSAPKWSVSDDAPTPCIRYGELYTKFGCKVDRVYSYTNISPEKLVFSKGTEVLVPRVGEDPMDYNHCTWLSIKGVAIGEMISVYNTQQNPLFTAIMFNATLQEEFAKRVEGGSVTNLYYDKLKNITVSFPSHAEQSKIAAVFENIDTLITLHQRKFKILFSIKNKTSRKCFVVYYDDYNVRKANAWEQRKLGELCDVFRSGEFIKASDIYEDGAFPVYGGNGLRGYADRFNYDGNYALIGRQGALCGNMNFSSGKAYFTEHAVAVHANDNNNTRFLFYLLDTMNLGQYSAQSAQPGLAVNKLITLPALCPSKPEQETIAEFLIRIDSLITLHQREFSHTKPNTNYVKYNQRNRPFLYILCSVDKSV